MTYNSLLLKNRNIQSVISDGCDLVTAFHRVLKYFDPNKNKNYKTKVLDCSYSHIWNEQDLKMFEITDTKNLSGFVLKNKFDLIIYEPPRNKNFYEDALNSSKTFFKVIKPEGVLIIKMNDFKEKGSKELKGTFDVWDIFSDEGFYLYDNIVYNFNKPSNTCEVFDRSEIIHLCFMIFKKK